MRRPAAALPQSPYAAPPTWSSPQSPSTPLGSVAPVPSTAPRPAVAALARLCCPVASAALAWRTHKHLLQIKSSGHGSVFWETTMESHLHDYRAVDGVNIAHVGRTAISSTSVTAATTTPGHDTGVAIRIGPSQATDCRNYTRRELPARERREEEERE
uniref:Uncharacterized protein n=1 Tax=Oryza brachyantha TaxID=4533 RepID=J3LW92_ORYBR